MLWELRGENLNQAKHKEEGENMSACTYFGDGHKKRVETIVIRKLEIVVRGALHCKNRMMRRKAATVAFYCIFE